MFDDGISHCPRIFRWHNFDCDYHHQRQLYSFSARPLSGKSKEKLRENLHLKQPGIASFYCYADYAGGQNNRCAPANLKDSRIHDWCSLIQTMMLFKRRVRDHAPPTTWSCSSPSPLYLSIRSCSAHITRLIVSVLHRSSDSPRAQLAYPHFVGTPRRSGDVQLCLHQHGILCLDKISRRYASRTYPNFAVPNAALSSSLDLPPHR